MINLLPESEVVEISSCLLGESVSASTLKTKVKRTRDIWKISLANKKNIRLNISNCYPEYIDLSKICIDEGIPFPKSLFLKKFKDNLYFNFVEYIEGNTLDQTINKNLDLLIECGEIVKRINKIKVKSGYITYADFSLRNTVFSVDNKIYLVDDDGLRIGCEEEVQKQFNKILYENLKIPIYVEKFKEGYLKS